MDRSGEYGRALLAKARGDAYVLERLVADPMAPIWAVGFHAQQAAEKALKAVLSAHGVEYPRTHNLSLLLDLLRDGGMPVPPDAAELPGLTPFGAMLRYDEGPEPPMGPALDKDQTPKMISRTIRWAASVLGVSANGEG